MPVASPIRQPSEADAAAGELQIFSRIRLNSDLREGRQPGDAGGIAYAAAFGS